MSGSGDAPPPRSWPLATCLGRPPFGTQRASAPVKQLSYESEPARLWQKPDDSVGEEQDHDRDQAADHGDVAGGAAERGVEPGVNEVEGDGAQRGAPDG